MRRIALAIAYDGTRFEGYARQPGMRTVEAELLDLLTTQGLIAGLRQARFRSGSRTDRSVSAAWNVVAFDTEAAPGAIVAQTVRAPEGLHLLSAVPVPAGFEPRHADRRVYRYLLENRWNWERVGPVARSFEGNHDFSNFRRADGDKPSAGTIAVIRYRATPPGPYLEFAAPRFLWQQVRRIVKALQLVNDGAIEGADIRRALDEPAAVRDFGLAPPERLLLLRVEYGALRFPQPPAVARARLARDVAAARRRADWLRSTNGQLPTTRR